MTVNNKPLFTYANFFNHGFETNSDAEYLFPDCQKVDYLNLFASISMGLQDLSSQRLALQSPSKEHWDLVRRVISSISKF